MRSKYEIKAQKELEADGWTVDNKAGMARFSVNRDFFNLFDLVAVRKGCRYLRYISIKGHIGGSARTAHMGELADFYLPPCVHKELWIFPKTKQKKWIKIRIQ